MKSIQLVIFSIFVCLVSIKVEHLPFEFLESSFEIVKEIKSSKSPSKNFNNGSIENTAEINLLVFPVHQINVFLNNSNFLKFSSLILYFTDLSPPIYHS